MPTVTVPRPKGHGTASRPPVKRSWRRADNKTMPTQRYDHNGGRDRFPGVSEELMRAVDQADSARYSLDEVLHPQGWTLLNFLAQSEQFVGQLRRCTSVRGTVAVVDLRPEDVIHAGNRFMVYALFPECSISAHVLWGKQRQNTVVAVGKSILNRSSGADIGALMLSYGAGGHVNAGTCQVRHDQAEHVVEEIVSLLNAGSVKRAELSPW
jgi:nanoRNase/pAp phosphatase (c-di-AMP/oligoRNAs hydrolase)